MTLQDGIPLTHNRAHGPHVLGGRGGGINYLPYWKLLCGLMSDTIIVYQLPRLSKPASEVVKVHVVGT